MACKKIVGISVQTIAENSLWSDYGWGEYCMHAVVEIDKKAKESKRCCRHLG